jgi:hypothetical protein
MIEHRQLPVAVPTPTGRPLHDLTDDEIKRLVQQTEPFLFMLLMVPGGILGIVATCVLAGLLPFIVFLQLGAPKWMAFLSMLPGAAAGLQAVRLVQRPLVGCRRALVRANARRAVRRLGVRAEDSPALVDALSTEAEAAVVYDKARALVAATRERHHLTDRRSRDRRAAPGADR